MTIRRIRSDSDDEAEAPSPKHMKLTNGNAEMNGNNSNDSMESGDDDDAERSSASSSEPTPAMRNLDLKPLEVDTDGFVEGSIVKLTLTNFVTYDYCEIAPGPHMNMIIGPNGTGKSTIVCAIALGLGGSPALLGRAKDINEFVKTGEDESTILIELKKVGIRNVTISRSFKKGSKSSTWRVNGRNCPFKEVQAIVNGFNIQVDNLCQFLPQDRVAEFAELTPPLLLQRTQAAAGKAELHEMQQKLVQLRDDEKALMKSHESDLLHLRSMKAKNQELERDVLRMQQREKLQKNIKLLESQIPLVKYTESKARHDRAHIDYEAAKDTYQRARDEVAPIKNQVDQVKAEKRRANIEMDKAENTYKTSVQRVKEMMESIKTKRAEINSTKRSIEERKAKIPEKVREIERLEAKINHMEEQLANRPDDDTSQFENAITRINEEIRELNMKQNDVNSRGDDEKRKLNQLSERMKYIQDEMKKLANVRQARLKKLVEHYPDIRKGCEWLRDNRDKFKGRVFEPAVLLLNLKDPRYAHQVEIVMGGARSTHLRSFICEQEDDYRMMTNALYNQMKLKININWPDLDPGQDYRKTPTTTEELRAKTGLEHYVSDLLEGPKYLVDALCFECKLQLIPVSINRVNAQQIANSRLFQKFVSGDTFYKVKTSLYGKRSAQTQTTLIPRPQYLGDSIDSQAQASLKEDMRTIQANQQQTEVVLKEISREHDKIKADLAEKRHAKEDQQSQKRDVQKRIQTYEQGLRRCEMYRKELVEMRKRPKEDREAIAQLEQLVERMVEEEDAALKNYAKYVTKIIDLFEERNKAAMLSHFMDSKYHAIGTYAATLTENMDNAQRSLGLFKDALLQAQRETKECMTATKDAGRDVPEDLIEEYNEIVLKWRQAEGGLQTTLVELESHIAEAKGKVAGIRFANANAMEHYQDRKKNIETYEIKAEQTRAALENMRNQIQTIKGQWAPLIKELVARIDEKFSAAFSRIKCAGAIQLEESEDFDKWGINILVKFRDAEKLQLLTGQRQSGGERSVSTILYLMSLQDLAASPFRVVDEINQGMDPRNERMIHEQIVQSATREGTSQYFLITPKLLPDLFYNDRMRVLCIYNSEWLPEKIKPLQAYLEHAKATGIAQVVEYIYTEADRVRETNDTITLKALNSLDDSPELHMIESVLCCKTSQDPYLLIICSDDNHNNYMFSHNVRSKVSKAVEYNKPIKGDITHTDMTCSPFRVAYVDRINTIDTKPSFAMVIGTKKDDATLVLLTLDLEKDVLQVELTETFKTIGKDKPDIGYITAICILTADKGDKRMGHSDPQILLGFSQGAILIYRIRAHVYSYKASRIRVPVDLSEFTEFPGYPITQLSCARSYNSLLMNVALAQEKPDEIKYQYRRSYIKVVETRGDFTRRQRAIINPPENIQSHAQILETKLIPSTTTVEDSTLQLSIIFQNGDKTYDLNIWEVSPTKISQALTLAMDQQSCIDTMAKSETIKSLKLDSNGYLNHVPQKIADIILEENEDDDTKHTATTSSTSHSAIDENATSTEDNMAPVTENTATNAQSAQEAFAMDEAMAAPDEHAVVMVDKAATETTSEPDEDGKEQVKDSLENIIGDLEEIEQDQHTVDISADPGNPTEMTDKGNMDGAAPENTANAEYSAKRENANSVGDESSAKRQKLHNVEEENGANSTMLLEKNLAISLDETAILVRKQVSDTSLKEEEPVGIELAEEEPVEVVAAVVKLDETHTIKVEGELQEEQNASEIAVVESVVLEVSEQEERSTIEDDYVVIDRTDIPKDISTEDLLSKQQFEGEASMNSMDEDTLVEHDDSMSDSAVEQPDQKQAGKTVDVSPTGAVIEDSQGDLIIDSNAKEAGQMAIEDEEDTDMTSREIEMLDEDEIEQEEHPDFDQDDDRSGDMMDDYGQDYADQADDASEMFNQVAYDSFQKEELIAMGIASSKEEDEDLDELEEEEEKESDHQNETPSSPSRSDTLQNQDLREASYLEEGDDEIHDSDALERDPIQDKDLLNEEDSIKFISGGELSDLNNYSNGSTPQQQQQAPQPHTTSDIDYIPVRAEDLLRLLNTEPGIADDHMDIDTDNTPTSHNAIAQPENAEAEPEPVDENEEAYTTMLEFCFGTTDVELDTISQSDVDSIGSYCWHHSNIQLKMFMLKYCVLHQMYNEGFLMAKALLHQWKKSMTKEEVGECIELKKTMKVDPSVQFGDIFDPFSESARRKMAKQKQDYLKTAIPVDFYESQQGQMYLDYYTTGSI
ncbi:P-loop containing nucleoside triphosphate hydrolase protein [Mucor ambiguus]|uniref:Structural maintenance of chromosomes protein 5 n=1 Tax=Mucor ambiguus TaxID=91626 RepID=A0A0C9N3R5_9FUNG|nr:P-loop containing nucleoside triphosphate hydrolase protein [Mucor ambiguus]